MDPFQEADEMLIKERTEELEKQQKMGAEEKKRKERVQPLKVFRSGIGKYLNTTSSTSGQPTSSSDESVPKKKKPNSYGFGNFGSW